MIHSLFYFGIAGRSLLKVILSLAVILAMSVQVHAAEVSVAVAANFTAPMQKIAQAFEQETGHKTVLSFGSTGSFYAQIHHGAPFQILLAADDQTPIKIENEGLGISGTRFTYAIGKLVLWSKQPGLVDDKGEVLRRGKFERIAIANPKLAPYGAAAMQALSKLDLLKEIVPKIVQGENIAQTYHVVITENAQLGFVALSQVIAEGKIAQGSGWIVPSKLHAPIAQDAIVLSKGRGSPAAAAFMNFLRSERAKMIIRAYGYDL